MNTTRCVLAFVSLISVAAAQKTPRSADSPKRIVEAPIESLLKPPGRPDPANSSPQVSTPPSNPRVKPGNVKWHASLADACVASERSNKPVLLFHLLGKLDERFT